MNKTVLNQAVVALLTYIDEHGVKTPTEAERQEALLECCMHEELEVLTISYKKKNKKFEWKVKESLLGNAKLLGFFDEEHWHDDYLAISIVLAVYLQKRHALDMEKLSSLSWTELVAMASLDVHGAAMKALLVDWQNIEDKHFWKKIADAKLI